jgi:hypothetical protein
LHELIDSNVRNRQDDLATGGAARVAVDAVDETLQVIEGGLTSQGGRVEVNDAGSRLALSDGQVTAGTKWNQRGRRGISSKLLSKNAVDLFTGQLFAHGVTHALVEPHDGRAVHHRDVLVAAGTLTG